MSAQHHDDPENVERMRRFIEQNIGTAPVRFPHGRLGAEDDGELSYAIAADPMNGVVRIAFPKPVTWIGLDISAAEQLRDKLNEKIETLKAQIS